MSNQIENVCIHIVGTKTDLLHLKTVETDEIANYARISGHQFTELSNCTGRGVEKAFTSFMDEITNFLKSKNVIMRNNKSLILANNGVKIK